MKMVNKESYANIPNVAFGFGGKYHLDRNELMVLVHLQYMKQYGLEDVTMTTVDMLIMGLDWKTSNDSRDRKQVVTALEGLQEKGYIEMKYDGKINKAVIVIEIVSKKLHKEVVETSVDWKQNPFKFTGWTEIKGEEYNVADNDGYKMMIFAYAKWRDNAQFTYQIAFKEWELVLGVSDKTARDKIAECDFLEKISGAYVRNEKGQVKQETNAYVVKNEKKPDVKKVEKEVKKTSYLEKFAEKVTDVRIKFDDNLLKQMFDNGTKIDLDGYTAWLETECPVYKAEGERKFAMLENSGNGWIVEKLENEYKERKSNQERISQWMESAVEAEEFVPSFKKKEDTMDYSIFED